MQTMIDEAGKPAGPHRVYLRETNVPGLAVSRCFGDYVAAAAGVTSTPDVVTMMLPTGGRHGAHSGHSSSGSHGRGAERGRHPQQHPQQQQQQRQGAPAGTQAQQGQGRSRSRTRRGGGKGRHADPASRGRQQGRRPAAQRGAQAPPVPAAHATIGTDKHVLIVASDGLWEFVSSAEAVRIAARCALCLPAGRHSLGLARAAPLAPSLARVTRSLGPQGCMHAWHLASCPLLPLTHSCCPLLSPVRRCANAQLAAESLALEAQAQWAVKFGGMHCDDITGGRPCCCCCC